MRAAPAFQVSVQRFAVWRVAVNLLAALAVASVGAWVWWQPRPIDGSVWALALVGATAGGLAALSVARQRSFDLRWDGQAWFLGRVSTDPGDLRVVLDLGGWMMLRFTSQSSSGNVWLPVQRLGLEASWHALRCAVYGARPAGQDDDAVVRG